LIVFSKLSRLVLKTNKQNYDNLKVITETSSMKIDFLKRCKYYMVFDKNMGGIDDNI